MSNFWFLLLHVFSLFLYYPVLKRFWFTFISIFKRIKGSYSISSFLSKIFTVSTSIKYIEHAEVNTWVYMVKRVIILIIHLVIAAIVDTQLEYFRKSTHISAFRGNNSKGFIRRALAECSCRLGDRRPMDACVAKMIGPAMARDCVKWSWLRTSFGRRQLPVCRQNDGESCCVCWICLKQSR